MTRELNSAACATKSVVTHSRRLVSKSDEVQNLMCLLRLTFFYLKKRLPKWIRTPIFYFMIVSFLNLGLYRPTIQEAVFRPAHAQNLLPLCNNNNHKNCDLSATWRSNRQYTLHSIVLPWFVAVGTENKQLKYGIWWTKGEVWNICCNQISASTIQVMLINYSSLSRCCYAYNKKSLYYLTV